MRRTRAALLFRLAVVAAGPLIATASGHEPPAVLPIDATLGQLALPPLAPVLYPPALLEIPRDVVPVALDFTPPMPEVDQRQRDDRAVEQATERQRMPAETQPQGLFHGEAERPAPKLNAPRIQRLPEVAPQMPVQPLQAAQRERAALPPRRSAFLPEREELRGPAINPPAVAATKLERLPPVEVTVEQEAGLPSPQPASVATATNRPSAMQAVTDRAAALVRHGGTLADRGAFYSARAEFIQALRLITQALDAQSGTQEHSQALADGLKALTEADDFSPHGSQLEADLDLVSIVAGHRTTLLKETDLKTVTPLTALQQYYGFAQERLSFACGNDPAGSQALFGLGKLTTIMAERSPEERRLHGPKAVALYQAALQVDARNHKAASELGVLLATFGQWQDAKRALLHALELAPQPETWHNLATVHQHLGEQDLAKRAKYELQLAKSSQAAGKLPKLGGPQVEWVDVSTFAKNSPEMQTPAPPVKPSAPRTATKPNAWSNPWLK